jgi:hypothetical protein
MNRSSRRLLVSLLILQITQATGFAQKRRPPAGGRVAIVVDERLAALRDSPSVSARLLHRLSRGRLVAITGSVIGREGIAFYRVNVTRRTRGWIQREAVASPTRLGDEKRFYRLIVASEDFNRIARARIFLDFFPRSAMRPAVLLLYAAAAEAAAEKLTRETARRLDANEVMAGGAPEFSYFLNYSGLDRYNRQGVRFTFDEHTDSIRYDGAAWREILRRYPHSPEAAEARQRQRVRLE